MSNTRLLTKDELDYFNFTYKFASVSEGIIVSCIHQDRKVLHYLDKDFSINSKTRKITIKKEVIKLWRDSFLDSKYTLIDIQNAYNCLAISYQTCSADDIIKQIKIINKKLNENV